jgi:hypothetical protein
VYECYVRLSGLKLLASVCATSLSLSPSETHHHCRGLGNSNEGKFEGKKRFLHIAFQGRFKRDVKASDFWSGHEWFSVSDLVPTRCELCYCVVTLLLLFCYLLTG